MKKKKNLSNTGGSDLLDWGMENTYMQTVERYVVNQIG